MRKASQGRVHQLPVVPPCSGNKGCPSKACNGGLRAGLIVWQPPLSRAAAVYFRGPLPGVIRRPFLRGASSPGPSSLAKRIRVLIPIIAFLTDFHLFFILRKRWRLVNRRNVASTNNPLENTATGRRLISELVQLKLDIGTSVGDSTPTEAENGTPTSRSGCL